jgi:hypothetical protein
VIFRPAQPQHAAAGAREHVSVDYPALLGNGIEQSHDCRASVPARTGRRALARCRHPPHASRDSHDSDGRAEWSPSGQQDGGHQHGRNRVQRTALGIEAEGQPGPECYR